MRAILTALMLMIGSPAGAECGNLCDYNWMESATEADLQAELDAGADVMARNKFGDTPLHFAAGAKASTAEVIQSLLAAGADIMARNEHGSTPLHKVSDHGTSANIQPLLDAGADAKAKNKEGRTPWNLAQKTKI